MAHVEQRNISGNFYASPVVILCGALMRELYYFFADAALIALRSIFAQKMRAFLTLIGIIIGVSSVVVVGASISGFNSYIVSTVSRILGVNHFMMDRFAHQGEWSDEEWDRAVKRNKEFRIADYESQSTDGAFPTVPPRLRHLTPLVLGRITITDQ